jgi:hypothetical protein
MTANMLENCLTEQAGLKTVHPVKVVVSTGHKRIKDLLEGLPEDKIGVFVESKKNNR